MAEKEDQMKDFKKIKRRGKGLKFREHINVDFVKDAQGMHY